MTLHIIAIFFTHSAIFANFACRHVFDYKELVNTNERKKINKKCT